MGGDKIGSELALGLVADKWFVLLVHQLQGGTKRYGELQKGLPGISPRMLTLTLRNMERDGLVTRTVYPVVPPKTEYTLTELGRTLVAPLHTLCLWAEDHIEAVLEHRARFQAHTPK